MGFCIRHRLHINSYLDILAAVDRQPIVFVVVVMVIGYAFKSLQVVEDRAQPLSSLECFGLNFDLAIAFLIETLIYFSLPKLLTHYIDILNINFMDVWLIRLGLKFIMPLYLLFCFI